MTERPTLEPGQHVICTYRMPPPNQPWLYEVYVGVVNEPTPETTSHNLMLREWYPSYQERVDVLYPFGLTYDLADRLIPITPEEARLPFRAKIQRFLGEESLACYDKASLQLDVPEEERI